MTLRPPVDPLPDAPRAVFAHSVPEPGEEAKWTGAMLTRVVLQTADPSVRGRRASEDAIEALVVGLCDHLAGLPFRGEIVLGSECAPAHPGDARRLALLAARLPGRALRYRAVVDDKIQATFEAIRATCPVAVDTELEQGSRHELTSLFGSGLAVESETFDGIGAHFEGHWHELPVTIEERLPWPSDDPFAREHPCLLTRTEMAFWVTGDVYPCHQQAPFFDDAPLGNWRETDLSALFFSERAMDTRHRHWTPSVELPEACRACPYPADMWLLSERKKLGEYRDRHRGERCFVLGNSPSLKELDLTLLKGEVTFGVNRVMPAYEQLGLPPVTYYCASDPNSPRHVDGDFARARARRVFLRWPDMDRSHDAIYVPQNDYGLFMAEGWFPRDLAQGATRGKTVINDLVLPLAWYMGFHEVILIGVDLDWMEGGETSEKHFYSEDSKDMKRYVGHVAPVDEMLESIATAARVFEAHGRRIVNASPRGRVDVVPRVDWNSLFVDQS